MTQRDPVDLAQTMTTLAMSLENEQDSDTTLQAIVNSAVAMVPGAEWAGISFISGREVVAKVPTHELVREIDQLQSELGEGPCLSAIQEQHTVQVDDMSAEAERWPRFAKRAVELGALSLLSFRLSVRSGRLGALNLYGAKPGVFTTESELVGGLFAQHAAVALAGAVREDHLDRALRSRDLIGQAKGILMERHQLTGQQGFDLLVRASQDAQMKLVEVARWLVEDVETQTSATRA